MHPDRQRDVGVGAAEPLGNFGERSGGNFLVAAEPDHAGDRAALQRIDGCVVRSDDLVGMTEQLSPVGGQDELLAVAPKESDTDAFFETPDLVADRRLSDTETLGRCREAIGRDEFAKNAEGLNVEPNRSVMICHGHTAYNDSVSF